MLKITTAVLKTLHTHGTDEIYRVGNLLYCSAIIFRFALLRGLPKHFAYDHVEHTVGLEPGIDANMLWRSWPITLVPSKYAKGSKNYKVATKMLNAKINKFTEFDATKIVVGAPPPDDPTFTEHTLVVPHLGKVMFHNAVALLLELNPKVKVGYSLYQAKSKGKCLPVLHLCNHRWESMAIMPVAYA